MVFCRNRQGAWKSLILAKSKHYGKQRAAQGKCTRETHSALGGISSGYTTCAYPWQVWDSYSPKPPCPMQTNVECCASLKEFARHVQVSHYCNSKEDLAPEKLQSLVFDGTDGCSKFFQMLLQFGLVSFCRIRSYLPMQKWAAGMTVTSGKSWAGALRRLSGEAGTTL